jgi:ribonuclease-3
VPQYRVTEDGPDHQKSFNAEVIVGSEPLGSGSGSSKKEAEQMAAEVAWTQLTRRAQAVLSSAAGPVQADPSDDGRHAVSGQDA